MTTAARVSKLFHAVTHRAFHRLTHRKLENVSQIGISRYPRRRNQIRRSLEVGLYTSFLTSTQLLGMSMSVDEMDLKDLRGADAICEAVKGLIPSFKSAYRLGKFKDDFDYAAVRLQALVLACALEMLDQNVLDLTDPTLKGSISSQMRRVVNHAYPRNLELESEQINRLSALADRLTSDLVDYATSVFYAEFLKRVVDQLNADEVQTEWYSPDGRVRLLKGFVDEVDSVARKRGLSRLARDMERTVNNAISVALNRAYTERLKLAEELEVPRAGTLTLRNFADHEARVSGVPGIGYAG